MFAGTFFVTYFVVYIQDLTWDAQNRLRPVNVAYSKLSSTVGCKLLPTYEDIIPERHLVITQSIFNIFYWNGKTFVHRKTLRQVTARRTAHWNCFINEVYFIKEIKVLNCSFVILITGGCQCSITWIAVPVLHLFIWIVKFLSLYVDELNDDDEVNYVVNPLYMVLVRSLCTMDQPAP